MAAPPGPKPKPDSGTSRAAKGEAVADLKQIGLAMHMFHDTWKRFPPAVLHQAPPAVRAGMGAAAPPASQPYSWRVALQKADRQEVVWPEPQP